jgi:hypothetical protein
MSGQGRLALLPETAAIRDRDWQVAPAPAGLEHAVID